MWSFSKPFAKIPDYTIWVKIKSWLCCNSPHTSIYVYIYIRLVLFYTVEKLMVSSSHGSTYFSNSLSNRSQIICNPVYTAKKERKKKKIEEKHRESSL